MPPHGEQTNQSLRAQTPGENSLSPRLWTRLPFTLLGLALIGVLLWQVSLWETLDLLRRLGWSGLWILFPYGVGALFCCQGWACALKTFGEAVPLARLYRARLTGEAVNNVTPGGDIGGEPLKVYMLTTWGVPTDKALASLVIARTGLIAGQILFILLGLPFFLHRLGLLRQDGIVLLPLLGLAYLFVHLFIRLQKKGTLALSVRSLKWALPWLERWENTARSIDVYLREFYHTSPRAFLASTFYNLLGWLLGTAETALILFLLGVSFRPVDAVIIESMVQPLTVAGLLIPGALGVKEAGGVFLCQLLGIDQAAGLTLMVLKRVPEAVYTLAGLFLLTRLGKR
jgi:uncharacterized protein (TIRG00374 family)